MIVKAICLHFMVILYQIYSSVTRQNTEDDHGNEVFVDEFSFPGLVVFCLLSRLLELKDMKRLMVYERKRKG